MLKPRQLEMDVARESLSNFMMRSGEIMYQVSVKIYADRPNDWPGWRTVYAMFVDPFDLLYDELELQRGERLRL